MSDHGVGIVPYDRDLIYDKKGIDLKRRVWFKKPKHV